MAQGAPPDTRLETALRDAGHRIIVGLDEVGKGSWAGPLTVGAAIVPAAGTFEGIRDSKQLTEKRREALFAPLAAWCVAWSVGHASAVECDRLGMSDAQRLAARRALDALGLTPDWALVDGRWDFVANGRSQTVVKGDQVSLSIAAASILAKVTRDRIMREQATQYPAYGFDRHKGYSAPAHRAALEQFGATPIHRVTWRFMENLGLAIPSDNATVPSGVTLGAGRLDFGGVDGTTQPGLDGH